MSEAIKYRLHSIVEGYVQGVGFRYFVLDAANTLGVTGWVRNRMDGNVEVLAEGERSSLDKLLQALYHGPRSAKVFNVTEEWQPASGEFTSFSIRTTQG